MVAAEKTAIIFFSTFLLSTSDFLLAAYTMQPKERSIALVLEFGGKNTTKGGQESKWKVVQMIWC